MRFSSPLWPVWIPAIVALVLIVRGWRSFLDFAVVFLLAAGIGAVPDLLEHRYVFAAGLGLSFGLMGVLLLRVVGPRSPEARLRASVIRRQQTAALTLFVWLELLGAAACMVVWGLELGPTWARVAATALLIGALILEWGQGHRLSGWSSRRSD